MIEDAPIVNDIRRVREFISQQFEHDIDRYLDYLCTHIQGVSSQLPIKKKVRTSIKKIPRQRVVHVTN